MKDNSLCTRPWRPTTQTACDRTHVRHGHLQTSCAARLASDTTTSRVITSSVVKLPFSFSHVTAKRASCVVTLMAKGKLHTATSDAGGGPVRHCAHRTITLRSARGDVSITLTSVSSRITETAGHTSACGQGGSALPRRTLFHKKLVMWSVRGYPASPLSFNSSACGTGLKSLTLPVWAQLPEISILARVRPHLFHAFLHKECQRRGDLNLIIRVSAHDGLFSTTSIQKKSPHFGSLLCEESVKLKQTNTSQSWWISRLGRWITG